MLQAEAPFNFDSTPGKLPKDVVPLSYDIQLKPNIEKLTFTGSETVLLDVRKPVKTITLNVNTVTIASAKLLGARAKIEQDARVTIDREKDTALLVGYTDVSSGQHMVSGEYAGKTDKANRRLHCKRHWQE